MMEKRKPRRKQFREMAPGEESRIWRIQRLEQTEGEEASGRDSKVLIKNLENAAFPKEVRRTVEGHDVANEQGITKEGRDFLSALFSRAKKEYGNIFPPFRFIQNEEQPDRWLVAQLYIDTANPPGVLDYLPSELPERAAGQLRRVVEAQRENFLRAVRTDDQAVLLDVENAQGNLLLSAEGSIYYVDSNLVSGLQVAEYGDPSTYDENVFYLAAFDIQAGKSVSEFYADPLYRRMIAYYSILEDAKEELLTQEQVAPATAQDDLFHILHKIVWPERYNTAKWGDPERADLPPRLW